MRISSVAFSFLLLLHAEMLNVQASGRKHHGYDLETTNLAVQTWKNSEEKIDSRNIWNTESVTSIVHLDINPNTRRNRRKNCGLHQTTIPNHRFQRKAHYHYRTGQSFQHYRKHHLKTTAPTTCNNTHTSKSNANATTNTSKKVTRTTHVEPEETTQKHKTNIFSKLLFFKIFYSNNHSTSISDRVENETTAKNDSRIEDENEELTPRMSQKNEETHGTLAHTTHTAIHTPVTNSVTPHTTTHKTTTQHTKSNEEQVTKVIENTTEEQNFTDTHTTAQSTAENQKKKIFNWLLHPHIAHKHITHYELGEKHYMALLVVADKSFINYHKYRDYDTYILTAMNMAAHYIRDVSFGVNLELVVSQTIFLEEEGTQFKFSDDMGTLLENFCEWAQKINPKDPNHPYHHDVAVFVTRQESKDVKGKCGALGASYEGGACVAGRSCVLLHDTGLLLGANVAHQLGHLLGSPHDDSDECRIIENSTAQLHHMMSSTPQQDNLEWSKCSRHYISVFFRQGMASCLKDEPPKTLLTFSETLPGVMYDADSQCDLVRLYHQVLVPGSRSCFLNSLEFCKKLFCKSGSSVCVYYGSPPAQGTPCGVDKWCWSGACVHRGWRPLAVAGAWGAWDEWSACSRPCGGGVQRARRACDSPPPHSGGRYCAGAALRHRLCHTQPCEPNSEPFRAAQCAMFNDVLISGARHRWRALAARAADPCGLYCASETGDVVRMRPRAADGTPCRPGSNDLCVDGVCTKVGCDWVLESIASEDRCGVCGGDGSGCHLVEGWYNTTNSANYSYQLIVIIPKGSRKIKVFEAAPSANILAIANVTDPSKKNETFFFHIGNKKTNAEGEFMIHSVIGVHAYSEPGKDMILINGPLPIDIRLCVICQSEFVSIHYSYMDIHATEHIEKRDAEKDLLGRKQRIPFLERNNPLHWNRYQWECIEWSRCSARCQAGTTLCVPHCVSVGFGRVSDSYCNEINRPQPLVRVCNEQPCHIRWQVGPWSACYNCLQWRSVRCMREAQSDSSPPVLVEDGHCCKIQPPTLRPCQKERICSQSGLLEINKVEMVTERHTTRHYFDVLEAEKSAPTDKYITSSYTVPVTLSDVIKNGSKKTNTYNVVETIKVKAAEMLLKTTTSLLGTENDASNIPEESEFSFLNSTGIDYLDSNACDIKVGNDDFTAENKTEIVGMSSKLFDTTETTLDRYEIETTGTAHQEFRTTMPKQNRAETVTTEASVGDLDTLKPSSDIIESHAIENLNSELTHMNTIILNEASTQLMVNAKNISNDYTVTMNDNKRKSIKKKKSRFSELKKFMLSKSKHKREVLRNLHGESSNATFRHSNCKNVNAKVEWPIATNYNKVEDNPCISIRLTKDCMDKLNELFDNTSRIKFIFQGSFHKNSNMKPSLGKVSTGIEDKNGNKIYDFDDVLQPKIENSSNIQNSSKYRFSKNLYPNEFVTKIPIKVFNTVVPIGSTNKLEDQSFRKALNIWIPISDKNDETAKNMKDSYKGKVPIHNSSLKHISKVKSNNFEPNNKTISLDLRGGGVTIQSLYNIINIYCNDCNKTISFDSFSGVKNQSMQNKWTSDDPTQWDMFDKEQSSAELPYNSSNYNFVEITLRPRTTEKRNHGLKFLKKCKRMFKTNKNGSKVTHVSSSDSFCVDHLRHRRNVLRGNDARRDTIKKISSLSEDSSPQSFSAQESFSTERQPKTVTPECKQTNLSFNLKVPNDKTSDKCSSLLSKLVNVTSKRDAEQHLTNNIESIHNYSGSDIANAYDKGQNLVSNLKIIKDYIPFDKIISEKVNIAGKNDFLNNLTEISLREVGDEIPTLNLGRYI